MDDKHPLLISACAYIEINLHRKIAMLELKQHTKCSERSLQMIFKKYLNSLSPRLSSSPMFSAPVQWLFAEGIRQFF